MACSHCLQKVDAPLKSFKKFFFNRSQRNLGRFSSRSAFLPLVLAKKTKSSEVFEMNL